FRVGAAQTATVEELLRALRESNVPTLALVMPEGPLFRSWYRAGAWNEIEAAIVPLCRKYGVSYYNEREWCDDEAWFFDSHHLTREGGHDFTDRLAHEVLIPHLTRPRSGDQIARGSSAR